MIRANIGEYSKLVRAFTAAEAPGGRILRIPLGDLPREIAGQPVFLAGLRFRGTVLMDTNVAMVGNMPGYELLTVLRNIRLTAGGHDFLSLVDGYHCYLDTQMRCGEYPVALPADVPDATASGVSAVVDIVVRCDDPTAPASQRDDGCIPIAMLAQYQDNQGNNALQVQVGNNFDGFGNVTITSFAFEVTAILKTFPQLRVPTPWQLRYDITNELTSLITPFGPIDYLVLANRANTAGTYARDHSGFDGLYLTVGNDEIWSGETVQRLVDYYGGSRLGSNAGVNGQVLTRATPEIVPLLSPSTGQFRTKKPAGRMKFRAATRSAHTYQHLVWREAGQHNEKTLKDFADALGLPRDFDADPKGAKHGKGMAAAMGLDLKVA